MRLNHINLGVTDVPSTVSMFEIYFGLRRTPWGSCDDRMAFLNDDAVISMFRVKDATYPKIFHIGFMQDHAAEVDAIHARLTAGGSAPEAPRYEHGRYTFYFKAPGDLTVEVKAGGSCLGLKSKFDQPTVLDPSTPFEDDLGSLRSGRSAVIVGTCFAPVQAVRALWSSSQKRTFRVTSRKPSALTMPNPPSAKQSESENRAHDEVLRTVQL